MSAGRGGSTRRTAQGGTRRAQDASFAVVADVARRAAVLLQAGVAPPAVWRYLANGDARSSAVLDDLQRGVPVVEAIARQGHAWRELAIAWSVASAVGAALADALRSFATGLRDAAEAQDDIAVALAEPAATARLMLWLPAVGLVMGATLGFDTVGILVADPRGALCLGAGLCLVVGARIWTARLIRRAQPIPGLPGIDAELFAIALSGGVSIDAAAEHVRRARMAVFALRERGDISVRGTARVSEGGAADVPESVRAVLDLSRAAGVPAVELLRAESAQARHRARLEGRLRASALGTRLLLPLGVCTLPSFLLLAVAPLVLSLLGSSSVPAF